MYLLRRTGRIRMPVVPVARRRVPSLAMLAVPRGLIQRPAVWLLFSRQLLTRLVSWLRGGKGEPDQNRHLAWRLLSARASFPETALSPPGGRASSTGWLKPALPQPRRAVSAPVAFAVTGCPLQTAPPPRAASFTRLRNFPRLW